eukprot:Pgem_evm1s11470
MKFFWFAVVLATSAFSTQIVVKEKELCGQKTADPFEVSNTNSGGQICGTETSFAYDASQSTCCFADCGPSLEGRTRWGWQLSVQPSSTEKLYPLYAGAGQCDLAKGTQVGNVTLTYNGEQITYTFSTYSQYKMKEVHVYADIVSMKNTSPGQYKKSKYGFSADALQGIQTNSVNKTSLLACASYNATLYMSFHSTVNGECAPPARPEIVNPPVAELPEPPVEVPITPEPVVTCANDIVISVNGVDLDMNSIGAISLSQSMAELSIRNSPGKSVKNIGIVTGGRYVYADKCHIDSINAPVSVFIQGKNGKASSGSVTFNYNSNNECCEIRIPVVGQTELGYCQSSGDPHTKTLDGKRHSWGGFPQAVIYQAQDTRILGKHVSLGKRNRVGKYFNHASYYSSISIQYKDTVITFSPGRILGVETLNNSPVEQICTYAINAGRVHYFELPDQTFIMVNTQSGALGLYVRPPFAMRNKVEKGVCGNFNGDGQDDYTRDAVENRFQAFSFPVDNSTLNQKLPTNMNMYRCAVDSAEGAGCSACVKPLSISDKCTNVVKVSTTNLNVASFSSQPTEGCGLCPGKCMSPEGTCFTMTGDQCDKYMFAGYQWCNTAQSDDIETSSCYNSIKVNNRTNYMLAANCGVTEDLVDEYVNNCVFDNAFLTDPVPAMNYLDSLYEFCLNNI